MQLACFGKYDGHRLWCRQFCWSYFKCKKKTERQREPLRVPEPSNSSAVDTGATQVEGGSGMNEKDFATRKAKAQKLEAISVGNDFMVKSSTRQGGYMVTTKEGGGYGCACMDYATHRGDPEWQCKHIIAVKDHLEQKGPTNSDSRFELLDLK